MRSAVVLVPESHGISSSPSTETPSAMGLVPERHWNSSSFSFETPWISSTLLFFVDFAFDSLRFVRYISVAVEVWRKQK
ncbi:hypothetical protein Bca101_058752 [Brassica carinata]